MPTDMHVLFKEALGKVNISSFSEKAGRPYRTLMAYRKGDFNPSDAVVRELIQFLREEAEVFTETARSLEEALSRKEGKDE